MTGYTEVARSVGLDPHRILAEVGLPRSCLDAGNKPVSASAVYRLLEVSAAASGVEDLGLRIGGAGLAGVRGGSAERAGASVVFMTELIYALP
ncbi:AraC family transcriptional regulator ligand-binding domain-containing protein [Cupriavidus sp. WKF15]|uniref:AraC family transcriptional regulator ligand-binding domain-containing protein n=1 Tax=Cupriavidus sp. WKF15 TaxID=3032282 RepID=UPI0023E2EFD1|nr:AraC family transcriptional regulator ligand-binding domain-containing protein [Cupriavidus sp. WKF15]WER46588.1 AraC family transcriptional regulator ligand-binding domain-containing protein [Cupriavidus sp. WKF15]